MFFCYFPDRFLRQICVYVYMYIIFVVLVVVCILCCAEEKEGVETRVVITEREERTKSVSYLFFPLISYER